VSRPGRIPRRSFEALWAGSRQSIERPRRKWTRSGPSRLPRSIATASCLDGARASTSSEATRRSLVPTARSHKTQSTLEELIASRDPDMGSLDDGFKEKEEEHIKSQGRISGPKENVSHLGPLFPTPLGQYRILVTPDRTRWVYLDPQGMQQGSFTGLEMHDWYKAGFFAPNLRVKRVEDSEFEPLGQFICRIRNSREPFLVPMLGISHGPFGPLLNQDQS
jgi:hypothetical protein